MDLDNVFDCDGGIHSSDHGFAVYTICNCKIFKEEGSFHVGPNGSDQVEES